MIEKIKIALKAAYYNFIVAIMIKKHPRDKRIVLFGAWMGKRFADNSRFLFQYLSDNKKELGLLHVVWITRSHAVYEELRNDNYEVCLAGTEKSKRLHLISGIQIICNNAGYGEYPPDIDVKYSWGAKKIQLWHGVGFKAVGSSSNKAKSHELYRKIINRHRRIKCLTSPGGWAECNILSTSKQNQKVMVESQNSYYDRVFVSCYPRFCPCIKLTSKELETLNLIRNYSISFIYLPTFRDSYVSYIHPLDDIRVRQFLIDNNAIWIEKQHSVSNFKENALNSTKNILLLDSDFDVNILYDHVNAVLSDYSSTVCDGIYKSLPTIMYVPDLNDFLHGSNGLLMNIGDYFAPIIAQKTDKLVAIMQEIIDDNYWNIDRLDLFKRARSLFFDDNDSSYEKIWKCIIGLKE